MSVVLVVGLTPGLSAWGANGAQEGTEQTEELTLQAEENTSDVSLDEDSNGFDEDNVSFDDEDDVDTEDDNQLDEDQEDVIDDDEPDTSLELPEEEVVDGSETTGMLLAAATDENAEVSDVLSAQSELTAQATYSLNWSRINGASGNASGAASGDTISLTITNDAKSGNTHFYLYRMRDTTYDGQIWKTSSILQKGASTSTTITVPTGYKFKGISGSKNSTSGGNGNSIYIFFESLPTYTLTLDYNGGKLSNKSSATQTGYVGYPTTVNKNPTRANMNFAGWNTRADGTGTHYENGSSPTFNGNTTLYAEWTRTATFTPGAYGSSNVSNATIYYNSSGTGYLNRTTSTSQSVQLTGVGDWQPVGWATSRTTQAKSQNASFNLTGSTLTKASTTFYSILEREVSITYDPNGADPATSTVPRAQTFTQVNYGGNKQTTTCTATIQQDPPTLDRAGFMFNGWEINGTEYQPGDTYTWSSADADANVTAKAIWVVSTLQPNNMTVSLADWTYGDPANTPSVTATYGAGTEDITYSTSATGPFTSTVPTDAGTYYVQAEIAKDRTAGYQRGQAVSTFTIHPRPIGIDWSNTSFTYDASSHEPTATATGLIGSDTCTVSVAGAQTNGGTHTAWAASVGNPNYTLPASGTTCPFTISPIPLTVTANNNTITYGDAPSGAGVTYTGLLAADDAGGGTPRGGVLGGTLGYTYTYSQYGDVGAYAVTPAGLSSPNYAITYAPGTLTVDPREVTLTWSTPSSFTYTGSPISWPVPTVGNLVNSDAITAVWDTASGNDTDTATAVGTYTPKVGSLAGTKAGNYKLPSSVQGSWDITAPPTNNMTVSIAGWTYGQWTSSANSPVVTAEHGASTATFEYYFDNGGSLGTQVTGADLDSNGVPKNAGNYWVKAIIPAVTGSYPGADATCAFTVSKAPITVTADDLQTKLNQPQATLTYTVAPGLASGDSLTGIVAVTPDSTNPIDTTKTGSYNIKMDWASGYSAANLPNYIVTLVDGTYTVTRGDATVSAAGYNGTYDGVADTEHITVSATDPNVTIYYSDTNNFATLIGGSTLNTLQTATTTDDASFNTAWAALQTALSTASYKTNAADYTYKDAGTYTVYFLAVGRDVKTDVIVGSKQVVINPAPLTVTANNKSIQFGDAADNAGVTYSGFVNSETESVLTGTLAYGYGTYVTGGNPGLYPITPSGLSATNYAITYAPGTLTVGPKELTIDWPTPDSFVYNGSAQNYGPATLNGVPAGANVSLTMGGTTSATNAGSCTATVTGLTGSDAANYTLAASAATSHTWTITPADLTITAEDNEITYGDPPAANGVRYTTLLGSDTAASLSGSLSYTYSYNQYDNVGDYTITPAGLSSPNYNITFADGTLKVKQRELTLTWPMPDALMYTGSMLTYGQPTLGNIVNGDDVSIDVYSGNTGTAGGAYTAQVDSIKGGKAGNYKLPSAVTHGWTINGATNTVTVTIGNWTYGDPAAVPLATDAAGVGSITFDYSDSSTGPWSTTVPTDAGTYYVRATVPASGYYAQSDAVASFEIYQRQVGLNWTNLSFVYDGNSHVPDATATGLIGSDVCNVTVKGAKTDGGLYTATASKLDNPNYKLPPIVTQLFTIAAIPLTITANDNTITYGDAPSGAGVTYTGLLAADDAGDGTPNPGVLSGTLQYTYNYNQYDDVGTYTITPTGLSSTSYAITYTPGTLTVDPREVTLTWSTPSSFTYTGSSISWPAPTVGNLVNSDAITAVWDAASGNDTDTATAVDTYTPKVGSLAGTKAGNYKLPSSVQGSWDITAPAANNMTVSITGWTYGQYNASANGPFVTASYGASTATFTYYVDSGGAPGAQVTGADLDSNGVPKNVGDYWVKADIAAGPSGSYPAASAQCAFSITKANITVTADDQIAVRNNTNTIVPLTYTISGSLASGDSLAGIVEAASDVAPNDINPAVAGTYTIKAGWASGKSASDLPNYNVTFVDGTYTVTRAIANVTATGYTGTYDGVADNEHIAVSVTDSATSTTFGGIGTGGAITVYYSESDFTSDVGSAVLTALQTESDVNSTAFTTAWSSLQSTISSNNYKTSYLDYTYKSAGTHRVYFMVVSNQTEPDIIVGYKDVVINKAPLTVTAGNNAISMGAAASDGGYTITGFVNGETEAALRAITPNPELSGTVSYAYGTYTQSSPMGSYPITPSGLTADNYNISYVPGTLSVGAIPLTLQWSNDDSFAYNGSAQTYATPTLVGVIAGDDVQVAVTTSTFTATDGGTYTATVTGLTGTDAAKYTISGSMSHNWTITPVALTVTAKDNSITYGDAPAANGVEYSGLLTNISQAGLTGSLSYTYGYVQCDDVGVYSGAITPGGLASPNYIITFVPGTLTVTPRQLSLVWSTPDALPYTGMTVTYPVPTLSGIVNSDNVYVDEYEGDKATDVGTYTAEVKTFGGTKMGNYIMPTDLTHEWKIMGASNAASVTLDDWTYGDDPEIPQVTATFGMGTETFEYYFDNGGSLGALVTGPDLDSNGVPRNAGTYWVKAIIPPAGGYNGAEATASFKIKKRPLKVTAVAQGVAIGESIKTGPDQVTLNNLASDDTLVDVTLTASPATPTTTPTFSGSITPSGASIENSDGDDMTANYDIEYEPALMVVQPAATVSNGKVIWAMNRVIRMSVAEATVLCEADDRDDQIIVLADAHACLASALPSPTSADELGVNVIDDGGFVPVVGVYQMTLKANPELGVTAIVYDNAETNPTTGVKVFANDTTPPRSVLRAAKAGDADAIAALIALAQATAVDQDGNTILVTDIDLSAVDPENPATYRAIYKTADGDSVTANITVPEEDDEADPSGGDDPDDPNGPDGPGGGDNPSGDDPNGPDGPGGGSGGSDGDGDGDGTGNGAGGNAGNANASATTTTTTTTETKQGTAQKRSGSPLTGDSALLMYAALTAGVIAAGIALFVSRRRKRDEE